MTKYFPSLIVLDRDNTIIVVPEETRYLYGDMAIRLKRGAADFIRFWNDRMIPVVVASNQQGIALPGFPLMTSESVRRFNLRLNALLGLDRAHIDEFFICPHLAASGCSCRKPKGGLILAAMEKYGADPDTTWVIGDKESDIEAGKSVKANVVHLFDGRVSKTTGPSASSFDECLSLILRECEADSR